MAYRGIAMIYYTESVFPNYIYRINFLPAHFGNIRYTSYTYACLYCTHYVELCRYLEKESLKFVVNNKNNLYGALYI